MELYLRFHQAKTLTGNCKNRTGKLKKSSAFTISFECVFSALGMSGLRNRPGQLFLFCESPNS